MNTLLAITNAADRAAVIQQNFETMDALLLPIGVVLPWCKSLTGVPALADRFVECNGQTLSDVDSPLNGQVIPNLNGASAGTKRFLRGATASGGTGGAEIHSHGFNSSVAGANGVDFSAAENASGTADANHLPPYYEVVWVMRVK